MTNPNRSKPADEGECYVEKCHREGKINRNLGWPDDGGIPKVTKYGHLGVPSLMETAFGIKGREMPGDKTR